MKAICSRFRAHVQNSSCGAKFSRIGILHHTEFLKVINRGLNQRTALMMIRNIYPIQQEGGLDTANTANCGSREPVGADAKQIAAARESCRTRRQFEIGRAHV